MPNAFLPRGALPGSMLLGCVEEVARTLDAADLFNVFPNVPKSIRESEAFALTLTAEVWMKVFRKGTVRAGTAFSNRVELNAKLFTLGTKDDVRDTFLHETAHILANRYYGKSCNHDWRWVRMARLLGDTGDRCHSYSYLMPQKQRLVYACVSCDYRYRRTKRFNVNRYRCGKCHGRLQLEVIAPGAKEALLAELKAQESEK